MTFFAEGAKDSLGVSWLAEICCACWMVRLCSCGCQRNRSGLNKAMMNNTLKATVVDWAKSNQSLRIVIKFMGLA